MRPIVRIALASGALLYLACAAAGETVTIAVSGQAAPDGNGVLSTFGQPVLNGAGEAAFSAGLVGTAGGVGDNGGIYLTSAGLLTRIVREGQAAPDGNEAFETLYDPALNGSGQVAFEALLTGTTNTAGIFLGSGGAVTRIARAGEPAPDGNGTFSTFQPPAFNGAGRAAFDADLVGTGSAPADAAGIFLGSGGAITQIARAGQVAPDGNGTFSFFWDPALNGSGEAAFWARLVGTDGGVVDDGGIFVGSGGLLTRIAREGQAAPDGNGTFSSLSSDLSLNGSGQAVFKGGLDGTSGGSVDDGGVFVGSGGAIARIAREGQTAPDGNGAFSSFSSDLALNDSGEVAFAASLAGTSGTLSDNYGLFRGSGGAVTQIVRKGQPAPDGNGTLSFFQYPAMNGAGQVAFTATLAGTSGGGDDDAGIFIGGGGQVVRVVREGEVLAGGTVTAVGFANGADERSGLNELAQVAYRATLADGRVLVAVFAPEPRWGAAGDGDWGDSSNWTLGIPPGATHDVRIDPPGSLTVTGPADSATVKSLTVESAAGVATLRLAAGGLLTAGDLTVDDGGVVEVPAGGAISAGTLRVRAGGRYANAGGSSVVGYLSVDDGARCDLSAGSLAVLDGAKASGTIDFAGGDASASLAGLADLTGASLVGTGSATLTVEPDSLAMFPPGFDPAGQFGSFTNNGILHPAGTTLIVPAGLGFAGSGEISDPVVCQGTIAAAAGLGIDLRDGLIVSGGGSVNLGSGALTVDGASGRIDSGGQLAAKTAIVGLAGAATLLQTSGANVLSGSLYLGRDPGADGAYELSGGLLSADAVHVGFHGAGLFTHTGGANEVAGALYVGHFPGATGTYILRGSGWLSADSESIGSGGGLGAFLQSGGANTVMYDLNVGQGAGYTLTAGQLFAGWERVASAGRFVHTGGTNAVAA